MQIKIVLHRAPVASLFAIASRKNLARRFMSSLTASAGQPAFSWCCTASISSETREIQVNEIAGYRNDTPFRESGEIRLDLTSSPDWMEYLERCENRLDDEGGAGAYDTMRCDLLVNGTKQWNIWGETFHLRRLQRSYRSLLHENGNQQAIERTDQAIHEASDLSHAVLQRLLQEAERSELLTRPHLASSAWEDARIQLIRLTLLWSPPHSSNDDSTKIQVRGHACSSAQSMLVHAPVQPIVASIAAEAHGDQAEINESMPSRHLDPQNKVASWTRLRKTFESPLTYKPPGVSEVLMVRPTKDRHGCELLEGLSSNVFVVYQDGTIRTAEDGVLFGYVRHLVLGCLERCGLTRDMRPILLQDAKDGLWKEVFITSSSRLIYPVSKILLHADHETEFEEFWSDPVLTNTPGSSNGKPQWQKLLDEILKRGGYPRIC